MEALTCSVCLRPFNDNSSIPMIFKICGHSLCKTCIEEMAKEGTAGSLIKIQCPHCRQIQLIDTYKTTIEKEFPKNYLFLQNFNILKKTCEHEKHPKSFVCIDTRCPEKQEFCFNCARKSHSTCRPDSVIKKKSFQKVVKFEEINTKQFFDKDLVKSYLKQKIDELDKKLMSLCDGINETIEEEIRLIELCKENNDVFWQNKDFLIDSNLNEEGQISISLKNKEHLKNFGSKIEQDLIGFFFEEIKKKSDAFLNNMLVESLSNLDKFKSFSEKESKNRLEEIKKMDKRILISQLLSNFSVEEYKSVHGFLGSVDQHLKSTKLVFSVKNDFNFTTEQKEFAKITIEKAFEIKNPSEESIKNFIETQFNAQFLNRWQAVSYFDREPSVNPSDIRYITFSRNDWFLVIKQGSSRLGLGVYSDPYYLEYRNTLIRNEVNGSNNDEDDLGEQYFDDIDPEMNYYDEYGGATYSDGVADNTHFSDEDAFE